MIACLPAGAISITGWSSAPPSSKGLNPSPNPWDKTEKKHDFNGKVDTLHTLGLI